MFAVAGMMFMRKNPFVAGLDAREQDRDPAPFQAGDGVGQDVRAGGVDGGDPRHPQDHDLDVTDLGELEEEVVGRVEEELPVDPVGDDVLVQQRLLLVGVVLAVEGHLVQ